MSVLTKILPYSHWRQGARGGPPLEINPGKAEIIRALNSSI